MAGIFIAFTEMPSKRGCIGSLFSLSFRDAIQRNQTTKNQQGSCLKSPSSLHSIASDLLLTGAAS